jgi:tetratricopeptide (TPR) repeat protein
VSGQAEKAIEHFHQLLRLSPHDALSTSWITGISIALFDLGRYEEAIANARHAVARPNPRIWAHAFLAAALHKLGQTDEAGEALKRVYSIAPNFSQQFVREAGAHWAPEILANRLKLLGEADVPEHPIGKKNY